MTKAELAAVTVWDEYKLGNLSLFIPLFNDTLKIVLFTDLDQGQAPEVTDKMTAIVNDLLQIKQDQLDRVKDLLWEECLFSFHVADYGCEPMEGESHVEAHLREFEISNAEDAFASIKEIHVSDKFENRYAEIKVDAGSNNYVSLIVKNGQIIDLGDDGVYLGWFEEDDLYLHKKRQQILAK